MKVGSRICMGSRMGFMSQGQSCFQVEKSVIVFQSYDHLY